MMIDAARQFWVCVVAMVALRDTMRVKGRSMVSGELGLPSDQLGRIQWSGHTEMGMITSNPISNILKSSPRISIYTYLLA